MRGKKNTIKLNHGFVLEYVNVGCVRVKGPLQHLRLSERVGQHPINIHIYIYTYIHIYIYIIIYIIIYIYSNYSSETS